MNTIWDESITVDKLSIKVMTTVGRIRIPPNRGSGCPLCKEEGTKNGAYLCGFSGRWAPGSSYEKGGELIVSTQCNNFSLGSPGITSVDVVRTPDAEKVEELMSTQETNTIAKLQQALVNAQAKLLEQQELLKSILDSTQQFGTVIQFNEKTGTEAVVAINRQLYEMKTTFKLTPGAHVKVVPTKEGFGITSVSDFQPLGQIARIQKVIDDTIVQIGGDDITESLAYTGSFAKNVEPGDKVMLDGSGQVIIRNFGQTKKEFAYTDSTGIAWQDIGGLKDAKEMMIEAIELPYRHAELYKVYNKKPIKGVLLYGPPGTGKTLLGKAAATAISTIHSGKGTDTGFIYIKGPEILSKWVGTSEEKVREIFARARKHKEKHGYPAVVFIDEADAILRKRGQGVSSDMESTIVPAFLAEMDGLDESGAVVILATNRPDVLDNAVTRDGRIDRAIKVSRPDAVAAIDIFKIHLKGIPLLKGDTHYVAKIGVDELYSSKRVLYEFSSKNGESVPFTLGHLCSGAMIAGVIGQATSLAMKRDIVAKNTKYGILPVDITTAVNNIYLQNVDLNHKDELSDFLEPIKEKISGVKKMRQCATT